MVLYQAASRLASRLQNLSSRKSQSQAEMAKLRRAYNRVRRELHIMVCIRPLAVWEPFSKEPETATDFDFDEMRVLVIKF